MTHWFTSDLHFGHRRIIELCNRPYASVEEMNEDLIARHNARVKPDDIVHFLGDVSTKHPQQFLARLNGKKRLFIGNHDDTRFSAMQCYESVHEATMLKINGQEIWCSHYAHVTWPKAHKGAWHLFGHSHGNLFSEHIRGKMMDVGVDCHNYAPISFEEIQVIMDRRPVYTPVDHHADRAVAANS
jgi:calcineurin-like phosphoesterase family protein